MEFIMPLIPCRCTMISKEARAAKTMMDSCPPPQNTKCQLISSKRALRAGCVDTGCLSAPPRSLQSYRNSTWYMPLVSPSSPPGFPADPRATAHLAWSPWGTLGHLYESHGVTGWLWELLQRVCLIPFSLCKYPSEYVPCLKAAAWVPFRTFSVNFCSQKKQKK